MRMDYTWKHVFAIAFLFLSSVATAQDKTVIIKTLDDQNQPIPYSFVRLIPEGDTTRALQDISDSTGVAVFHLELYRRYRTEVKANSFQFRDSSLMAGPDADTIYFRPVSMANQLKSVTVTYTKPLMRQDGDKTIIDPEEIAASSTNAFEMMEQVPALFIDQDGNIYLNSMTPARVYINGREQKLSAADIATILRSLPPNSVERIEILRTPSARYDASGGGGIVNVVLKKGVRIGLTGSVSGGFNQGTYGNQYAGVNITNNNGPTNMYINLQYSRQNSWERIMTDRLFTVDSILSQDAYTVSPNQSYYMGYGIGHALNDKWDINYDGRISLNFSDNSSTNPSVIKKISTSEIASSNTATVDNDAAYYNITQGINLKYKPDTMGSEWITDISYTYAPNNVQQVFTTVFEYPFTASRQGDGDILNRPHFFTFQSDLTKKLPKEYSIDAGIKTTNVWFRNSTEYYNTSNGLKVKDDFRSRTYNYTEHIHAAYLQASKSFAGFILKLGTRAEYTLMDGNQQLPTDTSFLLKRADLFPYVYLSRKIMTIAGYDLRAYLIYRRTINRPAYENLNPSPRYIDPYLFETGNPSLRPQFTKNYEANISVNERPLLAAGYNDTRDIFTQVVYQSEQDRSQAYRTYDNLGSNKETYFRAMGAIPPGRKYFFVVGGQYNYNVYEGLYENKPLSFERGSWSIFTYHRLKLASETTLSLNGFARFNGLAQFYELGSFGSVNISLSQKFFKQKLAVTASVKDVFFTNNNEFVLDQGSVYATGFRKSDTRRFGLQILYNFGFRKKEEQGMFPAEINNARP